MKRCENCFESNSDGATNCVICGDPLDVPQVAEKTSVALRNDEDLRYESAPIEEPEELIEVEVELMDDFDEDATVKRTLPGLHAPVEHAPVEIDDAPPEDAPAPPDDDVTPMEVDSRDSNPRFIGEPTPLPTAPPPQAAAIDPPPVPQPQVPVQSQAKPPTPVEEGGQVVLQVFHDKEPRVVHAHPVVNDITLVGREDPQRDVFPDLDLGKLPASEVSSGHASRQHLRLLRQGSRYYLYVYKGSTGTQVCDRMVDPAQYGKRFEIQVGDRIILGGKVRMKLARVK